MEETRITAEIPKPLKNWLSFCKRGQDHKVEISRGFLVFIFIDPSTHSNQDNQLLDLERYVEIIEIHVCWPYVDRDVNEQKVMAKDRARCLTVRCPWCRANGRPNRVLLKLDLNHNYIFDPNASFDVYSYEYYDDECERVLEKKRKDVPEYLRLASNEFEFQRAYITEACRVFKKDELPFVGVEARCRSCRNYFWVAVYLSPKTAFEQKRLLEKEGPALFRY